MTFNGLTLNRGPVGSARWLRLGLGALVLAGPLACGSNGSGAAATSGGTGGDDSGGVTSGEVASTATTSSTSGSGAGEPGTGGSDSSSGTGGTEPGSGGAGDCAGNPGGEAKPSVVNQVDGVTVGTLVGSGTPGTTDGDAGEARLSNPVSVLLDGDDLLVADFDGGSIRRVTMDGTVTTLTDEELIRPFGLALDGGDLIVQTDGDEHGSIYRVDLSTGAASLVADQVGRPRGMAFSDGLVVADVNANTVSVVDLDDGTFTDLAGVDGCAAFEDGSGEDARLNEPLGMVTLGGGDMLVADMGNHVIRRVTREGVVSTFAGDGVAGMVDGDADEARFNGPRDLAIDAAGNVYVSDVGNHRIRRIDTDGVVETIAGDGTAGFGDGDGDEARFFGQEGLEVTADGSTIYVADGTDGLPGEPYHRIRVISVP